MIDSTTVRAHQHSAGAQKNDKNQAIGPSHGGLSTKIHALVDALGNPFAFFLTLGKAHDLKGADALPPRMQAHTLLADKAFDADERVIDLLRAAGKTAVIPPRSNRRNQRAYDKAAFKARHLIENFFCNLMKFRVIATRYDRPKFPRRNPFGSGRHLAELRTRPSHQGKKWQNASLKPLQKA